MEELYLYNTLTRKKEKFEPITPGFVGIYVCGPTVYGHAHLGHAKSYISFDVIVRYFRFLGYRVRYVQNITDVGHLVSDADEGEDKVARQARLEQLEPMEIAERYTRSYFEDMDLLNVERPDISPRASGHIPEQIELAQTLLKKGYAYEVNGTIYFDVQKFKEYGKLSGRKLDELMAAVRIEKNPEKKHPADFAVWKRAEPGHIMQWNSPWGRGYPGWHAECSVMSTKYLGQPFDIHGGGLENVFPHHECEIAQSEAANDKPFARYWLHNNMVTVNGQKMGKSLGNFITIKDAVKKYTPLAIRYFVLSSHYRSPLDFSDQALESAQKGLGRFHQTFARLLKAKINAKGKDETFEKKIDTYRQKFIQAMNDDFNTPKALAELFEFLKEINGWLDAGQTVTEETHKKAVQVIEETAGKVLGLLPKDYAEFESKRSGDVDAVVQILIDIRSALRKEKNFALADEIRNRLQQINIELKDTSQGTVWEYK
ncbi:cysteinyl-tRNA synthetase [Caldithrix abyssi DSM 13497]|uniref:Cysteine--tRNA ligase n=1 Tax=Caldithrix abyssi DSM 13497 TaxID=880073 RepID=H1XP92_CALAY|nr:cysteine--tRNA ligase [Caldithrix abyssi]APF18179.1 cysS cysteinyl-tRNA synthetase [Caldithrix abyssi DSM 13497]EHO42207.1 cysteinyl-tRNA synthetase [Caldithrix abyssi DSM 13497]